MDPAGSSTDADAARQPPCEDDEACQTASFPEVEATTTRKDYGGRLATTDGSKLRMTPSSKLKTGWRRIVRNFTPSWFTVNMGTGIVSSLLHNLPYQAHWLTYLSYVVFALNVVLLSLIHI